ncbi:hypothetical protein A2Z33_00300 [Candidatus Gottesmanbacteria bacterium RBG_16_52_11]|uniref:Response regulatory domain-containing protein n=1 Tax=Candidatus Gottesmanbacteria bacterium RBG_16_52_11 TaxID=1798374 RepID=A0A1F5YNR2_9BACT|nr:MAG: hypothetical protein A2Z33_00300 [Candidatus Gottesmanbacteria bacterium RBG_16_52_11]
MNVLLVDDDQLFLKINKLIFEKQGLKVDVAHSGSEALDYMKTSLPDVVLLDVMMPNVSGLEVLIKMKSDGKLKQVPVIMITNLNYELMNRQAKQLGVLGCLKKDNYTPGELCTAVRLMVEPQQSRTLKK